MDSAILENFTMTSTEKQKWDNLRSNGGIIILCILFDGFGCEESISEVIFLV